MKKILIVLSLTVVLCALLGVTVLATEEAVQPNEEVSSCVGCEICNPTSTEVSDEMPPMKVQINGAAFVESLGLMGKGMLGIFVVTLVIIGVVAILNWHGRSLEKRSQGKE